jgi:hypothetical protein
VSLLGGFGIFLQKKFWVVIVAFAKVAEFLVFLCILLVCCFDGFWQLQLSSFMVIKQAF